MTVRVGLMGFGRLGRNIFRAIYSRRDLQVVAINELADSKSMEYLLRYDTLRGTFDEPVRVIDDALYMQGRQIPVLHHTEPGQIPWYEYGVDVVIEATGRYRRREDLQKHLEQGADRVILTVPPADPPAAPLDGIHLRGISAEPIDRDQRLISCGSSTANCCAVMVKVLQDAFGVVEGSFTSIHAYTNEQSLGDVPASDLRSSRAALENIVPLETWTDAAVIGAFPHLQGRFSGLKLNVPVPEVSCVDLTVSLDRSVTPVEVNEVFRSASASTLREILDFTEQPIVSSDVAGSDRSCVFDSLATMVVGGDLVKVIGWYAQGGGLASRIVEVAAMLGPRAGHGDRRNDA
ncbi:MAG: type I glyceraldehyde-3-phosphate dehydrogenase [Planctomycetota bacterium]